MSLFLKFIIGTFLFLFIFSNPLFAQKDSTITLNETIVRPLETTRTLDKTAASISVLSQKDLRFFSNTNLSKAFNAQAGVRMEERSPLSYRIAIRGSSLRSPFGVRNVKIYWENIPLTDANGISYFNQIDMNAIKSIEIIKGPTGNMYGAANGGVILLHPATASAGLHGSLSTLIGDFNSLNTNLNVSSGTQKANVFLGYTHTKSDGYRENSASDKNSLNLNANIFLKNHQLNILGFISDLYYQTPGGLTLAQAEKNPKSARLATSTLPGAVEQKAAISQNIQLLGISDEISMRNQWNAKIAFSYNHAYLENPFITNFEKRKEYTWNGRFILTKKLKSGNLVFGHETLISHFNSTNFDNNKGVAGNFQNYSNIVTTQSGTFVQADYEIFTKTYLLAGLSMNNQKINFIGSQGNIIDLNIITKPFVPITPRISILKTFKQSFSIFASAASGYSAPSSQEFAASFFYDSDFKNLAAEKSTNIEIGSKYWGSRFKFETAIYNQIIQNALVLRYDAKGNAYYRNAGKINQKGIELSLQYAILQPNTNRFINEFNLQTAYTFSDFKYATFIQNNVDYQNKTLPGVAKNNASLSFQIIQKNGFYLNSNINYLSKIALNDANTAFSNPAWMTNLRLGYAQKIHKIRMNIFAGAENILNQSYSFGYDFNAIGNRYFNPAPMRNYNGGVIFNF